MGLVGCGGLWLPAGFARLGVGRQRLRLRGRCGLRLSFGSRLFTAQQGQIRGRETGAQPGGLTAGGADHHLTHHAVEGRIEWIAAPIQQFQLHRIAASLEAFEPQGCLPVDQKAVAIHADAQPPAGVVVAEVLQGCIQQQPVDQHRVHHLLRIRAGRYQLRTAAGRQLGGVARHSVHPDLCTGTGGLHRFPPGSGGVHRDAVAAGAEIGHGHSGCGLRAGDLNRLLIVQLHDQMGARPKCSGIAQRPVPHLQVQRPAASGQQGVVLGSEHAHLGHMLVEAFIQLLHRAGGRHFLQGSCGGRGAQAAGARW